MSLPAAKDIRERAARVGERAVLSGTPRYRFLRDLRNRMVARHLPVLAMVAVSTGSAAITNLFKEPRWISLATALMSIVVALFVATAMALRKNLIAQYVICGATSCIVSVGWGVVVANSGGAASPFALAIPLTLIVILTVVPLPPVMVPALAAVGMAATALSAPDSPFTLFLVFALLAGGGYMLAKNRRRRALVAFRRLERLAAAVARMRRMQEQLVVVEKLEALRVLVGGMAHELNNSLAIALASTEQVTKVAERDAALAIKAANRAQGGLMRIRGTIEKLRRFAMAEGQALEPGDVEAMLDFALESAIGRARSGVIIDRDYAPDVGAVDCHVAALAEALYQVARNAVESMPKGGTVRASTRRLGDRVVIAVADEGQGIPPQRLARVFDPFYARESNDTTFQGGKLLGGISGRSGMGLSAVYGLVSSMGGKVEIKSEVGRGTEVSILLPLRGK